jgi:hypothetical protein
MRTFLFFNSDQNGLVFHCFLLCCVMDLIQHSLSRDLFAFCQRISSAFTFFLISTQQSRPMAHSSHLINLGVPQFHSGSGATLSYFFYCNSFIHMCIHCLGHFSPCLPSPTLSSLRPSVPGRFCSAFFITSFVGEKRQA